MVWSCAWLISNINPWQQVTPEKTLEQSLNVSRELNIRKCLSSGMAYSQLDTCSVVVYSWATHPMLLLAKGRRKHTQGTIYLTYFRYLI